MHIDMTWSLATSSLNSSAIWKTLNYWSVSRRRKSSCRMKWSFRLSLYKELCTMTHVLSTWQMQLYNLSDISSLFILVLRWGGFVEYFCQQGSGWRGSSNVSKTSFKWGLSTASQSLYASLCQTVRTRGFLEDSWSVLILSIFLYPVW